MSRGIGSTIFTSQVSTSTNSMSVRSVELMIVVRRVPATGSSNKVKVSTPLTSKKS